MVREDEIKDENNKKWRRARKRKVTRETRRRKRVSGKRKMGRKIKEELEYKKRRRCIEDRARKGSLPRKRRKRRGNQRVK